MNNSVTATNGQRKSGVEYYHTSLITPSTIIGKTQEEITISSCIATMGLSEELTDIYDSIPITGEFKKEITTICKRITEIIESAINLLDEVIEVSDDEIERINTFSLLEEKLTYLWELRGEVNQNFTDIIVLLTVAFKNSHYQNYGINQYQAIKAVLENIRHVNITTQQVKECRKLLMDSGVDLFAPIRNWEHYTVEIKKKDESE